MTVLIGVDPHKGSHTAVAIDRDEAVIDELRVDATVGQVDELLGWAKPLGDRTWAVESAGGLGYLLSQQLVAAGRRCWMCPRRWRRGCGCWAPGVRTRTTPTTPAPSPSPPCGPGHWRRCGLRIM